MIFGLDVSEFNRGVDLHAAKAEGIEFLCARVMSAALRGQGTDRAKQIDPMWPTYRDLGRRLWPDTFSCYLRVGWGQRPDDQVRDFIRHNPDRSIPVMPDHEQGGGPLAHLQDVKHELVSAGYRLTPWDYLPDHWWEVLGRPSLAGWGLWRSEYPDRRAVHFTEAYRAVRDHHWSGYGGGHVVGLQFSGFARVGRYSPLCVDAYRGTRDEFAYLLGHGAAPLDRARHRRAVLLLND